jgi:hypothetical protein
LPWDAPTWGGALVAIDAIHASVHPTALAYKDKTNEQAGILAFFVRGFSFRL